jgi:radical SAM protein with 4Fe4S-binding SPASM domain
MGDVAEEEFRRDLKCEKCGKKEDIKRCAKCKMLAYCSRDCQKSDWKKNKRICPQLVALREWAEEGDN